MTKTDTENFRKVRKDLIDIPDWLPRKPENDKEDIDAMKGFSDNIKNTGMMNPITLREKKDGRFDLIAGSRRLKASSGNEIWAKVEDKMKDSDKCELDSRIKCASENQQRSDLPAAERDKYFYDTYELAKKTNSFTSIKDLADYLGMSDRTLSKYIRAGEERTIKKNDIIITNSSTEALNSTKMLIKTPEVRNILLKMNLDAVLLIKDLPIISKNIENCIERGMSEKMIVQVIDMARETYSVDNNTKTINYDFDKERLAVLTTAITECEPDVRNYLVSKMISVDIAREINKFPEDVRKSVALQQISVKEAEEISMFEKIEQRAQLIKERIKINNWAEKTTGAIEGEWNKNISIRKQQVEDIKTNGGTELRTDFDFQHQRKLDLEADRAMYFDENTRKRYGKIYSDLVTAVAVQSPTKITKKEIKTDTTKLILEIYKLCRLTLLDLGVIRNTSNNDLDFIDADFTTKSDK